MLLADADVSEAVLKVEFRNRVVLVPEALAKLVMLSTLVTLAVELPKPVADAADVSEVAVSEAAVVEAGLLLLLLVVELAEPPPTEKRPE